MNNIAPQRKDPPCSTHLGMFVPLLAHHNMFVWDLYILYTLIRLLYIHTEVNAVSPCSLWPRIQSNRQVSSSINLFALRANASNLSLLATRKIVLIAWHDATWVEDVEDEDRNQHRDGVQAVLECFMPGNVTLESTRIFDQTKNDSDL